MSNRVPRLWSAASGPSRAPLTRLLARGALRFTAFVREPALADQRPFVSL
ncbi:hypothetical protein OG393_26710 [Streptomyces sp. NBC_01216]|nr:hypothetical protein OG393_26710 [Streptomyces sp. NBC_01216]